MPPNVLLVVVDSARAKNLGIYGHSRETTPFLSTFAERATVFEQARSAGTRSITGHASLFTGYTVEEHELTTADRKLVPGTTVFERLRDEGYETGVFSENVWITDLDIGLRDGFDTVVGPQNVPFPSAVDPRRFVASEGRGMYRKFVRECLEDERTIKSLVNGVATKLASDYPRLYPFDAGAPGDVYVDRFLDWQADRSGPWAACLNLMDVHGPYEPVARHNLWGDDELLAIQEQKPNAWQLLSEPSSWWKLFAVESLYDGSIHQADALLERLVNTLENRDAFDDTLLVITSDHGEGFGEPSRVRPGVRVAGHNTSLHEVILHVPLVVSYPGQRTGDQESGLASLTRFPAVVEQCVDDPAAQPDFTVERAYASSYGLLVDEQLRSRARRFQDPDLLEGFQDRMRAVYHEEDGMVRKRLAFGDKNAVEVAIRDAQTAYIEGETTVQKVDAAFESIEEKGVVEGAAGVEAVGDATKQRLEDLGYM